jgi:crossover junction endodeoxyribonuclease RuvC
VRRAWIGIDPGMSGALALLNVSDAGTDVEVVDMPFVMVRGAKGDKKTMDFWTLASIVGAWSSLHPVKGATIEAVHAMPEQGVTSSFNFGGAFYAARQALASAGVRETLVQPATWKAIYGLRGGRENKDMSRSKATEFYPAFAEKWKLKKHDGRAEAALLAHYGSKLRNA